ncbi:MAG TPA: AmpG family muropeptide MFS transporter [Ignavibacteriales bacterium]|nr:AmpG family muropeptide MFS transporter [Ignavibacteriales bacterium]
MFINKKNYRNPWAWVSTLYYAQGIPYVVVNVLSVIMYKNLGMSNADIAFYTSWLYLPWVIKPLWGPLVDIFRTKRFWIVAMQLVVGAGFAGIAFTLPTAHYVQYTLAFFWLIAFSSATHDIAADGFYMLGLTKHDQAFYVGIRSTFYRIATITGQGLLVILAGYLESRGTIAHAWSIVFIVLTALFLISVLYHYFILPYPVEDVVRHETSAKHVASEFVRTFALFFKKKKIGLIIAFLLIYRFGEAQLVKMSIPFLRDPRVDGGLGLITEEIGIVYGTVGVIALLIGGIVGGFLASRDGLKRWIWWMFAAINIPHVLYIYLAFFQPDNIFLISACVAGEQFGYGFGFTAYMLYMMYVADGEYKTAHYALCTGFMALSMMIPGMFSGWIEEMLGYKLFFVWILLTMIPGFFIMKLIPLEADYGKNDK